MRTALIVLAGLVLTGLGVYFGYTNGKARTEMLDQAAEQQRLEQQHVASTNPIKETTDVETEEAVDLDAREQASDLVVDALAGYEILEPLVDEAVRQFSSAESVLEDGYDYVAALETPHGVIVVELYADQTPLTVNNFVFLALQRYYDGVPFHRVLEDFMAQTGDPTGSGRGGPGYVFEDEIVSELTFSRPGILAMANSGPGTNGSQFFLTFAPTEWLNGNHTIFGHVTAGEELLDEIRRVDPSTPSGIAKPDDTFADLALQGVDLGFPAATVVGEGLAEELGAAPVAGQSFSISGYVGTVGTLNTGEEAYGFYPVPDTLQRVVIGRQARN